MAAVPRYPVMLDLSGRRCLVIGGGAVAHRKVRGLVEAGAHVTVVAPALGAALAELLEEQAPEAVGTVTWIERRVDSGDRGQVTDLVDSHDLTGLADIVRRWAECFQPTLDEFGIEFTLSRIWDGQQVMELEKYRAFGVYDIVEVSSQAEADEYWNSGQMVIAGFTDENGVGYMVIDPNGDGSFGGPAATIGVGLMMPEPPGAPELSGDEIDRLTAMELDLWAADQACQDDVGYADYNTQREQELVDRILEQFPEFG